MHRAPHQSHQCQDLPHRRRFYRPLLSRGPSIAFAFLVIILVGGAQDVRVIFDPNPIYVGEIGHLILPSADGTARLKELPAIPGFVWLSKVPSQDRGTPFYTFRVTRPGELQLPALSVVVGKTTTGVTPPKLVAKAPGLAPGDVRVALTVDGKGTLPGKVYVGQALEVELRLSIREDARLRIHDALFEQQLMPKLAAANAIVREYPGQNQYSRRFHFTSKRVSTDGKTILEYTYRTVIIPTASAPLQIGMTHEVPLIIPTKKRPDIEWHPTPERIVWYPIEPQYDPIQVVPIPPLTDADVLLTGLIGDFDISLDTDSPDVKVGDGLGLTLAVKGHGNLERLSPIRLSLPGFKVYDPQLSIRGMANTASIRWVLVPTAPDTRLPELRFASFSLANQEWRISKFRPEVYVRPGTLESVDPRFDRRFRDGRAAVTLPLWKQSIIPVAVLLFAGPIVFGMAFWSRLRQGDAARRHVAKPLAELTKALKQTEDLHGLVSADVLPFVRERLDLPPGATLDEICQVLDDSELAQMLVDAERSGFKPAVDTAVSRDALIRQLQKLAPVLLLIPLLAIAGEAGRAAGLYAENEFARAAKTLVSVPQPTASDSPDRLVNLGNCHYLMHNYGQALLWYERALRLAPRDKGLRSNLALAREKLGLGRRTTRVWDRLRPDEWLLVIAVFWLLAWSVAAYGYRRDRQLHVTIGVLLLAVGISFGCWRVQQATSYHPDLGMISQETALYRLPEITGSTGTYLGEGQELRIIETRGDWCRVKTANGEGWIPRQTVGRIVP